MLLLVLFVCLLTLVACRVIKNSKNAMAASVGNLQLAEEEIVLEVDGTIPTQPVLQHIGIAAWPGESVILIFKIDYIC